MQRIVIYASFELYVAVDFFAKYMYIFLLFFRKTPLGELFILKLFLYFFIRFAFVVAFDVGETSTAY